MADKEIKITFAEEKMEALVFFLGEQNEKVENILKAHLDKTYEKYVPQQVRKFVESRMSAADERNTQEAGGQRQAREQGRRNGRQGARQNAAVHGENRTAGNSEMQEQTAAQEENTVPEQEETQGMAMGM